MKVYKIYFAFTLNKECVIKSIDNQGFTIIVTIDGKDYTIKNCKSTNRVGDTIPAGSSVCYSLFHHIETDIPNTYFKEDNLQAIMNAQKRRGRFKNNGRLKIKK